MISSRSRKRLCRLTLLVCAAQWAAAAERSEPGPAVCDPECAKFGCEAGRAARRSTGGAARPFNSAISISPARIACRNCGEDGHCRRDAAPRALHWPCRRRRRRRSVSPLPLPGPPLPLHASPPLVLYRCPFGRLGKNCEIDFLSPCKPGKDGLRECDGSRAGGQLGAGPAPRVLPLARPLCDHPPALPLPLQQTVGCCTQRAASACAAAKSTSAARTPRGMKCARVSGVVRGCVCGGGGVGWGGWVGGVGWWWWCGWGGGGGGGGRARQASTRCAASPCRPPKAKRALRCKHARAHPACAPCNSTCHAPPSVGGPQHG